MIKMLLSSSLLVTLLCGPALADPPPATVPIGFAIANGHDTRHYAIKLVDHECGGIETKSPSSRDEVKACLHVQGAQLGLDIIWHTVEGGREIQNKSSVLVARNQSFDLDGGGSKLTVTVQ